MSYKILDAVWFTNSTISKYNPLFSECIGVVAVETYAETGEWKAYIGLASGLNPERDMQSIAGWGSGMLREYAAGFFPRLDIEKYKKDF